MLYKALATTGLLISSLTLTPDALSNDVIVYTSDATIDTYEPIFPSSADPNWTSSTCSAGTSIGLAAGWVASSSNGGKAYQFGTNVHPWQPSVALQAQWINAWSDLTSRGPSGHSWTRYTLEVSGTGEFDLTLLADNCSWVYVDGDLVGYQDDAWNASSLVYPVQLNGTHTLDFIIFDGGGLAGGMFRLETNTGRTYSDDDGDGLSNQEETILGTSPSNPDTDADGVSDGEEVSSGTDPLDATSYPMLDSDLDGVDDSNDYCPDTVAYAIVDAQGCSGQQTISQMCGCSGPSENRSWRSHGQYVSCVARARNLAFSQGLISASEGDSIVQSAAQSACGKR